MIAIIDYGLGNLFSLQSSLKEIGCDVMVTRDPGEIKAADRLILPGVGAYRDAVRLLKKDGIGELVKSQAAESLSWESAWECSSSSRRDSNMENMRDWASFPER